MQNNRIEQTEFQPSHHDMRAPIISNALLTVATALILWWAFTSYQNEIDVRTEVGSRYLTMEWNLLQELKSQTDAQLEEKNREIAALRRRYAQAVAQGGGNSDAATLEALQSQLAVAQAQRESLLRERIEVINPVEAENQNEPARASTIENDDATDTPAQPENIGASQRGDSPLTELLRREIQQLQTRLVESDETQRQLLDALTAVERQQAAMEERIASTVAQLTEQSARTESLVPIATRPEPELSTMEMLTTRAILRALITSPEIRAEYPELSRQLDQYLSTVETQARHNGRRDALAAASNTIETLAARLDVPVPTSLDGETPEGYATRLVLLLRESIARIPVD